VCCQQYLKLNFRQLVVTQVESNSIGQLVKSSSDYCRLCEVSLSSDQLIMLALKEFIPCYAAALFIKTNSALSDEWSQSSELAKQLKLSDEEVASTWWQALQWAQEATSGV
jgi:hypothetical protein